MEPFHHGNFDLLLMLFSNDLSNVFFADYRPCHVCGMPFPPDATRGEMMRHAYKCKGPRNSSLAVNESPMIAQMTDGRRRQSALK